MSWALRVPLKGKGSVITTIADESLEKREGPDLRDTSCWPNQMSSPEQIGCADITYVKTRAPVGLRCLTPSTSTPAMIVGQKVAGSLEE